MKHLLGALLYIFFFVLNLSAQEMPEPKLIFDSEELNIPFELAGTKIVFKAVFNGERKNIILDTGAGVPVILLDNEFAKTFGLKFYPPLPNGLGLGESPKEAAFANGVVEFQIDKMKISNAPLLRTDLKSLSPYYGMEIDGVFGGPIFKKFKVTIDYQKNVFTIRKDISGLRTLGTEVPIELHQGRPVVKSTIEMSNGKTVNGRFSLDTGARSTVFHQTFLERKNINSLKDTVKVLGGVGFAGKVFGYLSLSKKLSVGEFEMLDTPVLLCYEQKPQNIGELVGDDGLIGYDFLRNFKVTFDYQNNRIFLKKVSDNIYSSYDRSGLFLSVDTNKNFKVEYVVENSGAYKVGFKQGDIITQINNTASKLLKLYEINQKFKSKDDTVFSIQYQRGSRVARTKLTLSDLIQNH